MLEQVCMDVIRPGYQHHIKQIWLAGHYYGIGTCQLLLCVWITTVGQDTIIANDSPNGATDAIQITEFGKKFLQSSADTLASSRVAE